MALTPSNMLALGTIAPDFALLDTVSGKTISLADVKSEQAMVVMFICNHCPYVVHVNEALVQMASDYQAKGVSFVAISSNDVAVYPQDGLDEMRRHAADQGYSFPYLYDETQAVARAYDAACTPDFYIFDGALTLVYRGRFDSSTPGNGEAVTGADVRAALDALLNKQAISVEQRASMGCNIKWKC